MVTDENNQTLLDLQAALIEAEKTPPTPPNPKTAFTALPPDVAKGLPADVVKKINDRGKQLTDRATAVAKAQKVATKAVADALFQVQKIVGL